MTPSKSHLILLAVGAVAGYYLAQTGLTNLDFNGSQTAGVGPNPFSWAYKQGFQAGSGIKTA